MLAARSNRRRNLVSFCGAQNEHHPGRRFLNGFQQRVECFVGNLMRFINDEDLVAVARGAVAHVFAQLTHFIDAAVRCRIDFDDVYRAAALNLQTAGAHAAGSFGRAINAIQAARHDARQRSLAGAALAGEDIAVRDTVLQNRIAERGLYVILIHHVGERLRPVLSGDYLIHEEGICQAPGNPRHTG